MCLDGGRMAMTASTSLSVNREVNSNRGGMPFRVGVRSTFGDSVEFTCSCCCVKSALWNERCGNEITFDASKVEYEIEGS